ncbi:hypothetical protein J6590_058085, partial [Homalodisca vitripennis]
SDEAKCSPVFAPQDSAAGLCLSSAVCGWALEVSDKVCEVTPQGGTLTSAVTSQVTIATRQRSSAYKRYHCGQGRGLARWADN